MTKGITPLLNWARVSARMDHEYLREVLAEFLATFLFCLFAVGGTCNINAAFPGNFDHEPTASVLPVAFGYFVTTLIFGGVSGAHVNPAISIGMAIAGKLSWIKLHAFILVQMIGGYLGSLLAFGLFKDYFYVALNKPTNFKLQNIPGSGALFNGAPGIISIGAGFANEIVLTTIFMLAFLSIKDMWNSRSPRYAQGILIGLVVIGLGLSFGNTTAVAINPVRDLCPRLAALSLGWKSDAVMLGPDRTQWWSVGFFAPFLGAILGSFIYIFVVGAQLKYNDEDSGELVDVSGGDKWKATVFIPKLGIQQNVHQANSPYARVQFQP